MDSKPVVESLLYYTDNQEHMNISLKVARVLNNKRPWTPKFHSELKPHLSHFNKPSILVVMGLIISVFVIEEGKNNKRVLDVVNIEGNTTTIQEMGKAKLVKEANRSLNTKDYMPQGYLKHIIWMPYYEKEDIETTDSEIESQLLDMDEDDSVSLDNITIFTEHINKQWTIDKDIYNPDPSNIMETTQKEIINRIVKEI